MTEAGLPIFFRRYTNLELNHILLSGFLAAIDELGKEGMNSELKQVQFDDFYITIKRQKLQKGEELRFVLIHQHCLGFSRQEDCICVPSILEKTSDEFVNRIMNLNFKKFEMQGKKLRSLDDFNDFEDFIDSVVENHFQKHSIVCNLVTDLEFKNITTTLDPKLLGFVSFKDNKLFKYYLDPSFSAIKFHQLIQLVESWGEFLKRNTSTPDIPFQDFKDFKLAYSIKTSAEIGKCSFFTIWAPEANAEVINNNHDRLSEVVFAD